MFGKLFASMYDGTIYGHWEAIVTFQQMICLANRDGVLDMNPEALAARTSIPVDIIRRGIEYLEQPDPESRSTACEGRRIERLDTHRSWGWRIVNYPYYRALASSEQKLVSDRERLRKKRAREKALPTTNATSCDMSQASQVIAEVAHAEADAEASSLPTQNVGKGGPEPPGALRLPVDNSPSQQGMTVEEAKSASKVQWRPTIELLMAVSGRARIPKEELLYLDRLDEIHVMSRVQSEILDQKKRFLARCADLCGLTLEYLYNALKHQRTNTGKRTAQRDAADLRRVAPTTEKLARYEQAGKSPDGTEE